MVIYYLAAVCPQKYYEILYPNGAVSPAYTFNKLLAEGLGSIEEIEVNCIVPKVVIDKLGVYQTAEKENNINYIFVENRFKRAGYLGFLYSCMKLIREKSKSEKNILICDALSINFSILCVTMKIFYKYSNIAIVTDFPQYLGEKDKRTIGKIKDKFVMWLMRRYDRYILLTSAMGKIINAKLRPQCIIEGVCDTSAQNQRVNRSSVAIDQAGAETGLSARDSSDQFLFFRLHGYSVRRAAAEKVTREPCFSVVCNLFAHSASNRAEIAKKESETF